MNEALLPGSIDVRSKSGGWVVREVGRLVLCTTATHGQLAPKLWSVVEKLLEFAPPDVELAYATASGDWTEPLSRARLERHTRSVATWPTNGSLSIASLRERYEFELDYSGHAKVWTKQGWATTVTLTFPREQLYAHADELQRRLGQLLALAPWTSATLGLAVEGNEWRLYPLALENPGLALGSPSSASHDLHANVFGIAWLTFVSKRQLTTVGGRACLERAVETLVEVKGGVLARLSAVPQRGSTPRERQRFVRLATVLAPLLHRPKKVLFLSSHPLQLAWHERFLHPPAALRRAFAKDADAAASAAANGTPF